MSTSRTESARAAQKARRQWTELFDAYRAQYPELATEIDQMQRRELPAGWDRNLPSLPCRSERHRRPRCLGQSAERSGAEYSVVPGRIGRSRPIEQDHSDVRRRRRFPGRQSGREEPPFRHPRARDGRDRERAVLSKIRPYGATFFIFSDYARPAIRLSALMELPTHFRLHARCDGRRRRRTDSPARGASRILARHPRAGHSAARRCQRSRRGLPLHHAASPPAGRAGAVAAAACRRWIGASTRRRPVWRAAPTCSPTPRRRSRGDPDRFRQRSQPRGGCA